MFDFLLRWVGKAFSWAASGFSLGIVKLLALKTFLTALIITVVPVGLFKIFSFIIKWILDYGASKITSSGIEPATLQFVGFAGFIASHLMLPQSFAVIISAIFVSLVLRVVTLGIV